MTGFYNVTKKLKDALQAEPFVNTVSFGSLDDVDLNKQTIFPLSHMIVNNCDVTTNTMTFNISIIAMDIVDESKDVVTDIFVGNDNEQDVLNTQLEVLNRVIAILQRGDLYTDLFQIAGAVNCEPFVDRFENKLAGWAASFDVLVQNEMTVC